MDIAEAVDVFKQHHLTTLKNRTEISYASILNRLKADFADRPVGSIKPDEIGHFLVSRSLPGWPRPLVDYGMPRQKHSLISSLMNANWT